MLNPDPDPREFAKPIEVEAYNVCFGDGLRWSADDCGGYRDMPMLYVDPDACPELKAHMQTVGMSTVTPGFVEEADGIRLFTFLADDLGSTLFAVLVPAGDVCEAIVEGGQALLVCDDVLAEGDESRAALLDMTPAS